MVDYRLVRYIGEAIVPEGELEEIRKFVEDVFKRCDLATECDMDEGRIDRLVLLKTLYDALIKFYKRYNIYYVYLDFKSKRAEIAVLSAALEVIR